MQSIEWRPVVGYEGLYEVSNDGRIRSLRPGKRNLRELQMHPNQSGHLRVSLSKHTAVRWLFVHRVVAAAFLGPSELPLVRHLNDIKTDNRVENLAYGTPRDNGLDAMRNGLNVNWNKTHCPQGHEYAGENLVWDKDHRVCRNCNNAKARRYRMRHASKTTGGHHDHDNLRHIGS